MNGYGSLRYLRRTVAGVVVVGLLAPLVSCEQKRQLREPPPAAVTVAPVVRSDIRTSGDFVGRVEAVRRVDLRARVQGFLEQRLFEEGGEVTKGDLCFVIEKAPFEAALARAKADLAKAKANAAEAKANAARFAQSVRSGAVSRQQYDEAVARQQVAEAEVLEKMAASDQAELQLSYTDVHCPIDGRISRRRYTVGNLVGPASEPLATIVSQDPMYVTFPVSHRLILDYRKAAKEIPDEKVVVRLMFADGTIYEHPGRIDFAGVSIQRSTDTLTLRAVFPNPGQLLIDGQFVNVHAEREETVSALLVPRQALQIDQAGRFVLVVGDDNKVEVRRVKLGQEQADTVAIETGLREGERVIVEGVQKARPGHAVNPTEAEALPPRVVPGQGA